MASLASYPHDVAASPCSPQSYSTLSPASRLRAAAAAGARANPEEKPLPGNTSLNHNYRSPSRSPSTRILAGSPGTPTRRAATRIREAVSLEDLREDEQRAPSSRPSASAPRPLFMPTPRRGATKPTPYPSLAHIPEPSLAPPLADLSAGQTSMERYTHSPTKPFASSQAANAEQAQAPPGEGFSPAKRSLRSSASAARPTRDAGLENAPQRTLRSTASRAHMAAASTAMTSLAPGTPASHASMRASTVAASSFERAEDLQSGRASPERQSSSVSKPRAKVTEGVGSRLRSVNKPSNQRSTIASSTASPEKRGLGISMGLVGSQHPERHRARDGPLSPASFDLDEELADSSFVYADPEDPDGESLGLSNNPRDGSADERHESVMVHVRLRPPKPGEKCAWIPSSVNGSLSLEPTLASQRVQQGAAGPFSFDGLLTGSANRPVYISVARPLVRSALDGYDAVVFAYGQTASGKTFTLSGDERGEEQGIIPRAVRDIFRGIRQSSARREYLLRASYLEIWNENVKDLLEPTNVPQVRDDRRKGGKGTFVHPLREEIVTSPGQVRELLARGQANRHVGATDWNERSSRSHTCFKVTIESWERGPDSAGSVFGDSGGGGGGDDSAYLTMPAADASSRLGRKVRVSELCLIDLAGSEKYVSQGSDRRAEGAHINKSLLTLGKVIFALSEKTARANASSAHVPYRDSKLTRILQNSLSGNARVAVVCTINPSPSAVDESLSTLNFAKRVKKVSLHARRNEIEGDAAGLGGAEAQALIMRYRDEAMALRKKVAELQSGAATPRIDDDRMRQLLDRLDAIGGLVVRGGGVDGEDDGSDGGEGCDDSDDDDDGSGEFDGAPGGEQRTARPVSPVRRARHNHLAFSDPPHVLQEKLYNANTRIASLQRKLASRPSLPASCTSEADKDALIGQLQQQIRELEMVCEAQAADAPPKIREDVEREWRDRTDALEERLRERERFVEEMSKELERLRRANKQLIRLAHNETAAMVAQLQSPHAQPASRSKLHPPLNQHQHQHQRHHQQRLGQARPVSVLGATEMEAWREAYAASMPMAASSATASPAMTSDSRCATPTAATPGPNRYLRAPNRFRPRRSISHDGGLLHAGLQSVERELGRI
ncbi:related to Kinesin [Pseudozyma flocculosa]|uniref:Related to Kinesin n=1 Tax=Pseudozyma flocculosa TaxID=84751 RepID=A0A5C3EWP1_9BASI|nr:related to Kinesin [Pseudozyma flocculosa]